jgi:glucose-6-phosphate dehydrogenase assembly protein OpcA
VSATAAQSDPRAERGAHEDVWAERDTTPDAIDAALRRLLHERHVANDSLVPARVLNLVVIVDRDWKGETSNRLERVGRYHASRTVLCAVEQGRSTIDARALLSYAEPSEGGLGLIRERVELDIGPGHLSRLDSIIDPVLVSELPTLLWSPHGHEEGVQAVLPMVDVLLCDSDEDPDAGEALASAGEMLERVYVVDLAWLRTTPWRERLAARFEAPARRPALARVASLSIEHRAGSRASALLLAGWLASRLGWRVEALAEAGGALRGCALAPAGELELALEPGELEVPGLGAVSVECRSEPPLAVTLRRGRGGLQACERLDGVKRRWRILGASRGEGGILGEGVRQALLRDPTYGPALARARELCPA